MKIYFKNGMVKEILPQIGEIIANRIIEGCNNYQVFRDENGKVLLIVNLSEIIYIE